MNPMNDHALDPARLPKPRRDYKDTLFRLLFRDRNRLLSLYNAVNGTSCSSPEDLTVVTLENAVYMNMKNDVAFLPDLKRVYALCGTGAAPCKDYDGQGGSKSLIRTKLRKGKSIPQIADELERDETTIKALIQGMGDEAE